MGASPLSKVLRAALINNYRNLSRVRFVRRDSVILAALDR
jgi:hypothetical protein